MTTTREEVLDVDDSNHRWGVVVFVLFIFGATRRPSRMLQTQLTRMTRKFARTTKGQRGRPGPDFVFVFCVPICPGSRRTDADRNLEELTFILAMLQCQQARSRCRLDASRPHAHTSNRPFLCLHRPSSPLKLSCRISATVVLYCSTPNCAHSVSETVLILTNTLSPDEGLLLTGTA